MTISPLDFQLRVLKNQVDTICETSVDLSQKVFCAKIIRILQDSVVKIEFAKVGGAVTNKSENNNCPEGSTSNANGNNIRLLIGTRNPRLIPKAEWPTNWSKAMSGKTAINVFDLQLQQWRSFRFDSIHTFEVLDVRKDLKAYLAEDVRRELAQQSFVDISMISNSDIYLKTPGKEKNQNVESGLVSPGSENSSASGSFCKIPSENSSEVLLVQEKDESSFDNLLDDIANLKITDCSMNGTEVLEKSVSSDVSELSKQLQSWDLVDDLNETLNTSFKSLHSDSEKSNSNADLNADTQIEGILKMNAVKDESLLKEALEEAKDINADFAKHATNSIGDSFIARKLRHWKTHRRKKWVLRYGSCLFGGISSSQEITTEPGAGETKGSYYQYQQFQHFQSFNLVQFDISFCIIVLLRNRATKIQVPQKRNK